MMLVPDDEGNLPSNIFTYFITHWQNGGFSFSPILSFEKLQQCLEARLEDYNLVLPAMNIVLFRQAVEHITRISRIIQKPCGNALLLGVGGSGKQSLSRLATFLHEIT